MSAKPLIVITGPTACGKTARAVQVATALGGEIISADSRQMYRGMDLGTGKDLDEYGAVRHHLIDVADAGTRLTLFDWLRAARAAEADIRQRGAWPIMCGGTGMYVEAYVNDLQLPPVPENPELRQQLSTLTLDQLRQRLEAMKTLHNTTDVDTAKRAIRAIEIQTYYAEHPEAAAQTVPRPRRDAIIFAIDIPRDERRARIERRLKARIEGGMVDEVRGLIAGGVAPDDLIYYGLEYKFVTQYAIGQITEAEMYQQLLTAIHQFAKRQMTWFRGMERRGHRLHWLRHDMADDEFLATITDTINHTITDTEHQHGDSI